MLENSRRGSSLSVFAKSFLIVLTATCIGCHEDRGPTLADVPHALKDLQRIVFIGDSAQTAPSYHASYVELLRRNDDEKFRNWSGIDLETLAPQATIVRLARNADGYGNLAEATVPFCACGDNSCSPTGDCVRPLDRISTRLVVQLGMGDFFNALVQLATREDLRADPSPLVITFRGQVQAFWKRINRDYFLPEQTSIVVLNMIDPSDGMGDLAKIASESYPGLVLPDDLAPAVAQLTRDYLRVMREEASAGHATFVDAHSHFLGHGYHYDEPDNPNHHADDASRWIGSLFDPNLRGANELRRLVAQDLFGESQKSRPVDASVPPKSPAEVPENGWAKEVADSAVTQSIHSEGLDIPNVGKDPRLLLAAPQYSVSSGVALGALGAHVTVDMGAETHVTDGDGTDLIVVEYGTTEGGAPEPYGVWIASDPKGPFVPLGDGRGTTGFDLKDSGVDQARYVRIVSHAHASDITNGLGSPLFPGPEIDAVGAFYPASPR